MVQGLGVRASVFHPAEMASKLRGFWTFGVRGFKAVGTFWIQTS